MEKGQPSAFTRDSVADAMREAANITASTSEALDTLYRKMRDEGNDCPGELHRADRDAYAEARDLLWQAHAEARKAEALTVCESMRLDAQAAQAKQE